MYKEMGTGHCRARLSPPSGRRSASLLPRCSVLSHSSCLLFLPRSNPLGLSNLSPFGISCAGDQIPGGCPKGDYYSPGVPDIGEPSSSLSSSRSPSIEVTGLGGACTLGDRYLSSVKLVLVLVSLPDGDGRLLPLLHPASRQGSHALSDTTTTGGFSVCPFFLHHPKINGVGGARSRLPSRHFCILPISLSRVRM